MLGIIAANYVDVAAATYDAVVLADSPILYWRQGEASGASMLDSSGNARHGTKAGNYTSGSTGLLAGAATALSTTYHGGGPLEGQSSIASAAWMDTSYVTAELWVNTTFAFGGFYRTLICHSNNSADHAWHMRLGLTGALECYANRAGGAGTVSAITAPLSLNTTYHLAMTYDGTNTRAYINGVVAATSAAGAGTIKTGSGFPIRVAGLQGGGDSLYGGRIQEAAVYSTALSGARILAHYNAGNGTYAQNVLADSPLIFLPLNESSGAAATDLSGNSRVATIVGTPTYAVTGPTGVGNAMRFTGSQYVTLPDAAWMETGETTVECWAKTSAANGNFLAARYPAAGSTSSPWFIALQNSPGQAYDGIYAQVRTTAANSWYTADASTVSRNGSWHHIVVTYSAGSLKVYRDGSNVYTNTSGTPSGTLITSASADMTIAAAAGGASASTVDVAGFAVYGTALSAARILAHYNAGV